MANDKNFLTPALPLKEAGELDYKHLHGDTGPLVYPAGFVWLFMLFKAIFQWDHTLYTTEYVPKNFTEFEHDLNVYHSETDYTNRNVRPFGRMIALQLMFTGVYLCGNGIVARLYQRTKTMPWWVPPLQSFVSCTFDKR